MTGVTKAMVCAILCVGGMVHVKDPLLLIGKNSPCGGSGFPFTISMLLYHMSNTVTVNKGARCSSVVRVFAHGAMGHWMC